MGTTNMTTERKPRPHAGVIKAWADGYEIQMFDHLHNEWLTLGHPTWCSTVNYRVKPEPKKPPTTWYQVVYRDMDGDVMLDPDIYTEEEAYNYYSSPRSGVLLKLIPIYTEESAE